MKKVAFFFSCCVLVFFTGCYDRDILDLKFEGEPLDPVSNLNHTISGTSVVLSWTLPASIPSDIIQPVSVQVTTHRDGVILGTTVVPNAPTSFSYNTYDPTRNFRFVVKVRGTVNTTDPFHSNLRLSPGRVVEVPGN